MASRIELQAKLEELLGSRNVYYNPPTSLNMEYDCIRYSLSTIVGKKADNINYSKVNQYDLMVISRRSDPEVIGKLLDLPYCTMGTAYISDNLHHYPFTLYY